MSCESCSELLTLPLEKGKIFWLATESEMIQKIIQLFATLQVESSLMHDIVYLDSDNCQHFFESHYETISGYFNDLERQEIKVYVETSDAPFSYHALLKAKPLDYFLNLISDREFFEIIGHESLTSHFQPIVLASDSTIYGYEALIRGVTESGNLVYPDELFRKSARNGMNFKLDRLARETALKTAAVKKIQQKVFINFIPTAIYDPKFCLESTTKWANQLEFDPANIVFEVVETESVKDQKHLRDILTFYRNEGYKIALDDVGEGYSNLNMLIELRPDIIKVDRNIITDIGQNSMKQSVYKALYTIAKDHGIEVLAEGIETADELAVIESIGVDYMQGYYFSKPAAEPVRKL